jgi:hypothetical protein
MFQFVMGIAGFKTPVLKTQDPSAQLQQPVSSNPAANRLYLLTDN